MSALALARAFQLRKRGFKTVLRGIFVPHVRVSVQDFRGRSMLEGGGEMDRRSKRSGCGIGLASGVHGDGFDVGCHRGTSASTVEADRGELNGQYGEQPRKRGFALFPISPPSPSELRKQLITI